MIAKVASIRHISFNLSSHHQIKMALLKAVFLLACVVWIILIVVECQPGYTYPGHEYEYSLRRDYLVEKEREMDGNDITLDENETIVDRYLQFRKYEHFMQTRNSSIGFPPQRPIQEMKNTIETSDVYRLLKKLPKGGNMHTHENHQLSKTRLYDIVWASDDFKYLHILPENHPTQPWKLEFFVNPPPDEGWEQVMNHSTYSREVIQEHQHLIGILTDEAERYPSDSNIRWDLMNTLWGRGSTQLIANINIKTEYIRALYETALDEGVQYLETRKNFDSYEALYMMSTDPIHSVTYGKQFLNVTDTPGELDIQLTMNITKEFIADNPDFIGHTRIAYTSRSGDHDAIQDMMDQAVTYHRKYPEHFKGFDLVGEEDAGRSHVYFLDEFLSLYDPVTSKSKVPLFLHTGETSWPWDLMNSDLSGDLVSTAVNTFDALVLGARRVGHGLAYIKFPYLLTELKTRQVAVEVCPVSNQILGLQADLRSHPAQTYMSMGIPVVLGADDPGSFGYDHYTTDWYEAFMGWGLGLRQLKLLSQNAIDYSALNDTEKEAALAKWTPYWNTYIASTTAEACSASLDQSEPQYYRILPRDGAITGSTKVHIFGRNFERAVCSRVRCKFGDVESPSTSYVSNTHVICMSPAGGGTELAVNVSVSLNDGLNYMETGETFIYKYDPTATTMPPETSESNNIDGATSLKYDSALISCILIFVIWLRY